MPVSVSFVLFAAVTLSVYLAASTFHKVSAENLEHRLPKSYELVKRYIAPIKLLQLRLTAAMVCASALVVILVLCGVLNPWIYIPVASVFGVLAFMAPIVWFKRKESQRKEAFEHKLLDLTINLASGMRSGLALPQALESTAKRMGDPMREELLTVLREYRLGLELSEALVRLHERMPCEDLRLLVTTIKLTTKTGGSLVDVLEKMVDMIRGRTEFQERLKNMTAQGKFEAIAMSCAPIAAFVLLYTIDPVLMGPMLTTGTGWCAIGVIALLITCGYFSIKKIVTVEV